MLAGLGAARLGLRSIRVQAALVGVGAGLAVVGYAVDAASSGSAGVLVLGEAWTAAPHSSGVLEAIGSGGFALAVIGLALLACRTPLTWVVVPLRAVGSMPLSAYTAQLIALAVIAQIEFGGPATFAEILSLKLFLPLAVSIVAACTAWALLVGQGPLEWVIQKLSERASGSGRPRRLDRQPQPEVSAH